MKRKQGFTLIELLIAIAVLSIMAAALFPNFIVSRRINAKAGIEERVLNAAKRTMEELKIYPFEKLDKLAEEEPAGFVEIAGRLYEYEPLGEPEETGEGGSRQGYRLVTEYQRDSTLPDNSAAYLICAEADWGRYNLEEEDSDPAGLSSYSINRYQMPNIADISSFQNIVLDPAALAKDDERLMRELLLQVNPEEDKDSASTGVLEGQEAAGEAAEQIVYSEDDIHKYLHVSVKETGNSEEREGRLSVQIKAVYTVDGLSGKLPESLNELEPSCTLTADLISFKKKVVLDPKTGEPINRIYFFLPDNGAAARCGEAVNFKKLFISANLKQNFELYVIAPSASGLVKDDFLDFAPGTRVITRDEREAAQTAAGSLSLYTNIGKEEAVSLYRPEKRLYRLTVGIYEADYSGAGEDKKPVMGKELLILDSTKTE